MDEREREKRALQDDARHLLMGGASLGAISIATTAFLGATCPLCVVAVPLMLGLGAYKQWRVMRAPTGSQEDAAPDGAGSPAERSPPSGPEAEPAKAT
jgi:hypothetical protein